ncbi:MULTISPECIES: alpha-N-acetylglucosaminidase TIM-barrel domain-containing protein [unclassified Gilliamella]|uniref:alpha-N-acetylglucosaminidase TIM-barrel domain-containing protein n=1 Tax=unclassified Gilliamella TaxID=2685620 RepID=UPI0013269180|nr:MULTISPECIES: alpha-N-acetylglucosaminidase TIM-barrel domain-containing protein [unclassified Gilliamella]MWN32311.1 hypothetical protein [Gilliamella sp. Pra-s60]MWP29531.1 hypothetical protein [Gilliamella sp. Pra-s54]
MLWGKAVIDDIANHYDRLQADYKNFIDQSNNDMTNMGMLIGYERQIDRYKKEVFNYQTQIANYKLALSNDTEVMYRLIMQRDVFETASRKFLEKVDDKTKQIFLDTLKEVKQSQENKKDYREKMWVWCNQDNFSANLLWEVNNQDKIDYTATLYFPDVA